MTANHHIEPIPCTIIGQPSSSRIDYLEKVALPKLLEALGRADYQAWIRVNPTKSETLTGYNEAARQHSRALDAVAEMVNEIERLRTELDAVEEAE